MWNFKCIRLVSDGCSGQNKNSTIVSAVNFWLTSQANNHIKEVEILYPVTGHSFLLPDRVFGNIEKELRRKEVIVNPEEVYDIVKNYATVKTVGKDVNVLDFKKLNVELVKEVKKMAFPNFKS